MLDLSKATANPCVNNPMDKIILHVKLFNDRYKNQVKFMFCKFKTF